MTLKKFIYILIPVLAVILLSVSCKKSNDVIRSGGTLAFNTDTLTFDTVFTAAGSFTTQLKIYNREDKAVNISSVRLENGDNSYFHLNVNGFEGNNVKNVEIAANDSIYVFATVNIDPNDSVNTPFLITDKLIATLNGAEYTLPFMAFGQNAHYVVDSVLKSDTWLTDKPYVIIHNALVDSGETLTIPPGCRIYVNADSRLYVDGTLRAIGTKQDSIIFQGGRLDRKYFGYEGYPGEWGGLYFTGNSTNNILDYVILKNCGNSTRIGTGQVLAAAIQVNFEEAQLQSYTLEMHHTIIENSIGYGILSFAGKIYADNCLINTCGAQSLAIFEGGSYEFNNCTFVTYGTDKVSHIDNPTVAVLNYRDIDDVSYQPGNLYGTFRNCVIWGSLDDEVFINKKDGAECDLALTNCLVKSKKGIPDYVKDRNTCIVNQDPQFEDYKKWDYRPKAGSPMINNGTTPPADRQITDDLDGNPRIIPFDIGCYEAK